MLWHVRPVTCHPSVTSVARHFIRGRFGELRPAKQMPDQRDYEENQENEEQNLRDGRRARRYPGKPEDTCDDGDDRKDERPFQHDEHPMFSMRLTWGGP